MPAQPGHPKLRGRIVDEVYRMLDGEKAVDLALEVGRAKSTIPRRYEGGLRAWPADELLEMAVRRPRLAAAICTYLTGEEISGSAFQAASSARRLVGRMGAAIQSLIEALEDNEVDSHEARFLGTILDDLIQSAQSVRADLRQREEAQCL